RAVPDVAINIPALGVLKMLIPSRIGAGESSKPGHVEASLHMARLEASLRYWGTPGGWIAYFKELP
ncbi:MAG: hypothetical protein WAS25_08770, partial [Geothrix sp.]